MSLVGYDLVDRFVGQLGEMSVVEFEEAQPERVGVKQPEMDSLVSTVDGNKQSFGLS